VNDFFEFSEYLGIMVLNLLPQPDSVFSDDAVSLALIFHLEWISERSSSIDPDGVAVFFSLSQIDDSYHLESPWFGFVCF